MKKYGYMVIIMPIIACCMENKLKEAIELGDEHRLKELLHIMRSPGISTGLLEESINLETLEQLHQRALELAQTKEQSTHTLFNRHVFQRTGIMAVSAATGGFALFEYFKTSIFDQQKLAQLMSGMLALYHGGNNLYLAFTNRDAHNESARHHAIVGHLHSARQILLTQQNP